MQPYQVLCLLGGLALANAQAEGPAPAPVLLTHTMSGVLPVLPTATPFVGLETIEGALVDDGPMNPGFTGVLGNAVVQHNTPGTSFTATLPTTNNFDNETGSLIIGSITGTVPADGTGVLFSVQFSGFPAEAQYGPFVYHIHGMPVPADGNCTATMGHLDPTDRGEYYPCDNAQPQTCQAGDLAGKHGNITGTSFTASYLDPYLSTDPSSPYYFGDVSVVIHSTNVTRLTCANFMMASSAMSGSSSTASATAAPAMFTGAAAAKSVAGGVAGAIAVLAGALLL